MTYWRRILLLSMALSAILFASRVLPAQARDSEPGSGELPALSSTPISSPQSTAARISRSFTSPISTPSPVPISTQITSPIGSNCRVLTVIQSVTYPEGAVLAIDTPFVKTWRVQNTGSCAWDASYSLVYFGGDKMEGPQKAPLADHPVLSGETIDLSVPLVAPAKPGVYRGQWMLRSSTGDLFGPVNGPLTVAISTISPYQTTSLSLVSSLSGTVAADGSILPSIAPGFNAQGQEQVAFLTFDLSSIPANAVIHSAEFLLPGYELTGAPFDLGCLRLYQQSISVLNLRAFYAAPAPGTVLAWCGSAYLAMNLQPRELTTALQRALPARRVQFRLTFPAQTLDSSHGEQTIVFDPGIAIQTTYSVP